MLGKEKGEKIRYKQDKKDLRSSGRRRLAPAARAASGSPAGAATVGALGGMKAVRTWRRDVWGPAQVRRDRLVQRAEETWFQETFFRFCKFIVIIDMVWLMLPT